MESALFSTVISTESKSDSISEIHTVIVAVPQEMAVRAPSAVISATAGSEDAQDNVYSAFSGWTMAVNCRVSPIESEASSSTISTDSGRSSRASVVSWGFSSFASTSGSSICAPSASTLGSGVSSAEASSGNSKTCSSEECSASTESVSPATGSMTCPRSAATNKRDSNRLFIVSPSFYAFMKTKA